MTVSICWSIAPPLAITAIASLGARRLYRHLSPKAAAVVLTALAVGCALGAASALTVIAFAFVVQQPVIDGWIGWCDIVFAHEDRVPAPLGIASLALLGVASRRVLRRRGQLRQLIALLHHGDGGDEVLDLDGPTAFAVPGRPGHVVVSQAMLDCLDTDEQRVLFAHEQAHLDHRHHLYVSITTAAATALPLLRPLVSEVRLATERWADEVAAQTVGDRKLVGRAIAQAALAMSSRPIPLAALGIAGEVPARVEALLRPPSQRPFAIATTSILMSTTVAGVLACSALQAHHLLVYAVHHCTH